MSIVVAASRDGTKLGFKGGFAAFFIAMHAAALVLPWFFFSWSAVIVMFAMNCAIGTIGLSLGYHRLLTHRSFKVPKWLERTMALFGIAALQGAPTTWVGMHRFHHWFSDTDKDPHSSSRGFWWSHVGWMFFLTQNDYRRHAQAHLREERFYRFFERSFIFQLLLQAPIGALLYVAGGWPWVVWGTLVRIVVMWHCTFLVNSATHKWGYRNYDIKDRSRNTWWVAILTYGEGWHNNHHAQPKAAKFGRKPWEIDVSWWLLRILRAVRLAKDVYLPDKKTAAPGG